MNARRRSRGVVAALVASISLIVGHEGSGGGIPTGFAQALADETQHIFHGAGIVTAIDAAQGTITIDHGDIPGLMDAMEMMYRVKPEKLPAGLQKGDKIEFDVDGQTYDLVEIKKAPAP